MNYSLFIKIKDIKTERIEEFYIGHINENNKFSGIYYRDNKTTNINEKIYFENNEITIPNEDNDNMFIHEMKIDIFNNLMNNDLAYEDLEDTIFEYLSFNQRKNKIIWKLYHNKISLNNFKDNIFSLTFPQIFLFKLTLLSLF